MELHGAGSWFQRGQRLVVDEGLGWNCAAAEGPNVMIHYGAQVWDSVMEMKQNCFLPESFTKIAALENYPGQKRINGIYSYHHQGPPRVIVFCIVNRLQLTSGKFLARLEKVWICSVSAAAQGRIYNPQTKAKWGLGPSLEPGEFLL